MVPSYLPLETIIRLHPGRNDSAKNRVKSSTLGKACFIREADQSLLELPPDSIPATWSDHWRVELVEETDIGNRGCFLARPIERIHVADVRVLIPGKFQERQVGSNGGVLIMQPNKPGNWMLPLTLRRAIAARDPRPHAILVRCTSPAKI